MWGLGAIRNGAVGLVAQGAGAVKQGVVAGAKLLENIDEVGTLQRCQLTRSSVLYKRAYNCFT